MLATLRPYNYHIVFISLLNIFGDAAVAAASPNARTVTIHIPPIKVVFQHLFFAWPHPLILLLPEKDGAALQI